jgi:hypothetical protein
MRLALWTLIVVTGGIAVIAGVTVSMVCFGVAVALFAVGVATDPATSPTERRRDFLSLGLIAAGVILIAVSGSIVVLIVVMGAYAGGIVWTAVRDTSGPDST